MKKKLNYTFHNPNSEKETVDYILKIFIEANQSKVEKAIREEMERCIEKDKHSENLVTNSKKCFTYSTY